MVFCCLSAARPAGSRSGAPSPLEPEPRLETLRVLNLFFTGRERDVGLLPVPPIAFRPAAAAKLAVKIRRANLGNLHLENLLDGLFDLGLPSAGSHFQDQGLLRFLLPQPFLGDDR